MHAAAQYRPLLMVLAGASIALGTLLLSNEYAVDPRVWAGIALLATVVLLTPVVIQEERDRCLIGCIPALAVLSPWPWLTLGPLLVLALVCGWFLTRKPARLSAEGQRLLLLERQLDRYPRLLEACLALAGVRDRDQVAQTLVDQSMKLVIEPQRAAVFLQQDGLTCRASAGWQRAPEPADEENYVMLEARDLVRRYGERLTLRLPLRGDGRNRAGLGLGVFRLDLKANPSLDDYHIEMLTALARLGGIALATADLMVEARSLALTDSLTGLFGQHEFLRRLDEEVSRCQRTQTRLCVIMCDMDHLKHFNDTYGHAMGDQALHVVAKCLQECEHPNTIACRYGGEEFAMLLPGCNLPQARNSAEDIRLRIAHGSPDHSQPDLRVTASFGCAELQEGESGKELMARADAACYAAKKAGRNQVQVATA